MSGFSTRAVRAASRVPPVAQESTAVPIYQTATFATRIATLAIRVERHSATARALAAWLERQDGVLRVNHPALESHPQYALASRQLDTGGGMLSFELAGGPEVGPAFIDGLSIAELTASLGSVHTMVVHPPTTSHRQLSEDERRAAGIGPGLLRVSVGLEDLDDLIGDFERGLAAARAVAVRQARSRSRRRRPRRPGRATSQP